MNTIFFDIDGTLINTGGAGKAAMMDAMRRQSGRGEVPLDILVAGRSDRSIGRELFERNNLTDTVENWDEFVDHYIRGLRVNLPQRPGQVLPGVLSFVETMHNHDNVVMGLITGNIQTSAQLKLEHFGLWHFFHFGGYGDQHINRDDIARDAMAAAREHLDDNYDPSRVWVIGDTPNDVRCARAIGAQAIAVATGIYSVEELLPAKPDILLENLCDMQPLLELL